MGWTGIGQTELQGCRQLVWTLVLFGLMQTLSYLWHSLAVNKLPLTNLVQYNSYSTQTPVGGGERGGDILYL